MAWVFLKKLKRDTGYRIKLFLGLSLTCNFAYSIFLTVVGGIINSKWFWVLAVYYALLSITRVFVFMQLKTEKKNYTKMKIMRACGVFLLLINLAVSCIIFLLIYENQQIKHHEITAIALATYTFTILTLAIIGVVKFAKQREYAYLCVKIINLTVASVSLVTLTSTMLTTWGEQEMLLRDIMLPLLSGTVSVFIVVMAITMIRKANMQLRTRENE